MTKQINLQDVFLNTLRKDRIECTVFLMNGYQIKGVIRGYDNYVIMVESDGRQQVVFKHAVPTISPIRPVHIIVTKEESEGSEE